MSKFCRNCGSEVLNEFCPNCGTKFEEPAVAEYGAEQNAYENKISQSQPNYEGGQAYSQPGYGQASYNQPNYGAMPNYGGVQRTRISSVPTKIAASFTIVSVLLMTMFFVLFMSSGSFVRTVAEGAAKSDADLGTGLAVAWFGKSYGWLIAFWAVHTLMSVASVVKGFIGNGAKLGLAMTLSKLGLMIIAFIMIVAVVAGVDSLETKKQAMAAASMLYGSFAYVVMCIINGVFWLVSLILYAVGIAKEK